MKKSVQHFLLASFALAAFGAGACTAASDPASSNESEQRAPDVSADDASREAERVLLNRRVAPEPEVGGSVTITDDQVANTHTVFASFYKKRLPQSCGDIVPLEGGGECFKSRPCDPPSPPFMQPETRTVGTVTVSSTFDTLRLDPVPGTAFYPFTTRPGPFWRGDGDEVAFSFTGGGDSGAPAFSYRTRAPVGDVIADVRSPFARDVPLRFTWDYADGASPAVGDFSVRLFQQGSGGFFTCRAPLAQRDIEIPTTMLTRFVAGPATLVLASVAVGTSFAPFEQENVRLTFQLSSVVDTGDVSAPGQPNVSFR